MLLFKYPHSNSTDKTRTTTPYSTYGYLQSPRRPEIYLFNIVDIFNQGQENIFNPTTTLQLVSREVRHHHPMVQPTPVI